MYLRTTDQPCPSIMKSSVFKGTPGFIPPEQMFEPTKATDLYALGTTLICLLTGIKSTEVIKLCDRNNPYLIKFSHLLPKLSLRFVGWLENMVQPEHNKHSYMLLALAGTGLSLASMLLKLSLKRRKFIAKYRQYAESLIKP